MSRLPPDPAQSVQQMYRHTRRAALGGLIVTLTLGVAKLLGGWLGHSLALLSDSVHSLGDALSSGSILLALWWAEQPADREHPYGHTRVETVIASNVALLLMLSGVWIIWEAIHSWYEPSLPPQWYTIVIAAVSAVLNEAIFRYSMAVAKSTGSRAVEASAWDQRLDVFGSLVVLGGLAVTAWGGPAWHGADHVTAIVVAVIILYAGATLFWGSLQDLLDRQAEPEMLETVRRLAAEVPGVRGVEKLLVRKSGLEFFADIHIEVDAAMTVADGHLIGHQVKDRLLGNIPTLRDVLVHLEPYPQPKKS